MGLPLGKSQLWKQESYLCHNFSIICCIWASHPQRAHLNYLWPTTLNGRSLPRPLPPKKNITLKTRVPWLNIPFGSAVEALLLQHSGETGEGGVLPLLATPHAVGMDGIWDSFWSISKLDNEQEFLIRVSSWGIVAEDVINNGVWSALRVVKMSLAIWNTLCLLPSHLL